MVAQRLSAPEDISITVGIMMFTQCTGDFGVSPGEANLSNRLINTPSVGSFDVTPATVLGVGTTGLRQVFPDPSDLVVFIASYLVDHRDAWIFSAPMIRVALFALLAVAWKPIKKEPTANAEELGKETKKETPDLRPPPKPATS